jgi:3-hydroxyisobutyrate dehydrogenase-like beta-hydroxyacid dehydrogenase
MRIAVIGLGSMGGPIARNLVDAGHAVSVYNRSPQRAEPFRALGAHIAATAAEAAADVEAAITILADDAALEHVVFGGMLQSLPAGAVHISMSTIGVALSERLAEAHRAKGQHYVSAPVFGRPQAAAARQLFVVAAGEAAQIARCRAVFDALGQRVFVAGDAPPLANVVKLLGNFMIMAAAETLAEAFACARKSGLEPATFLEIMTESLFGSPIYRTYGAMLVADRFEPAGFKLPLAIKDNRLLLAAAERAAVPMPLASLVRDRLLTALAQGFGESDWAIIARISRHDSGLATSDP